MLKFNKSTLIALYAMLDLASSHDGNGTVAAADIASRWHVSRHHLAKVLQQLVRAGLVRTTRGASGGHSLAREPKNITLFDIVEVFEGPRRDQDGCLLLEEGLDCGRVGRCTLQNIFEELDDHVAFTLQSVSLKTLVNNSDI